MRLRYQFEFIQAIRDFFRKEDFMDILTPPMVQNPGMETHIHPFQVYSTHKNELQKLYLHTSPEFAMKKLLSLKDEKLHNIFQISYCFRDEPKSPEHRPQFLMLEWYRKSARYEAIMQDCEKLIIYLQESLKNFPLKKKLPQANYLTIAEVFEEFCGFNILDFSNKAELKEKIKTDFKDVPLPEADISWEDYYFLIFLNKIEPQLKKIPFLILYEYPAQLAALSTIKKDDPRVCERFEIYLRGVEIGNCFNELTNFREQKERFDLQNKQKNELYGYILPEPTQFYDTLQRGFPFSAGIAVGVERLIKSLTYINCTFFNDM